MFRRSPQSMFDARPSVTAVITHDSPASSRRCSLHITLRARQCRQSGPCAVCLQGHEPGGQVRRRVRSGCEPRGRRGIRLAARDAADREGAGLGPREDAASGRRHQASPRWTTYLARRYLRGASCRCCSTPCCCSAAATAVTVTPVRSQLIPRDRGAPSWEPQHRTWRLLLSGRSRTSGGEACRWARRCRLGTWCRARCRRTRRWRSCSRKRGSSSRRTPRRATSEPCCLTLIVSST